MSGRPIPASIQEMIDTTKVEYVKLGSSGLRVSVPILGTMTLGSSKWIPYALEEEESLEILKAAYDRGVNTWDTADMYSNGVSEELIGKAIRKFNIPREKVVIMTKSCFPVAKEPGVHAAMFYPQVCQTKDFVNQGGELLPLNITPPPSEKHINGAKCRSLSQRHIQSRRCLPVPP